MSLLPNVGTTLPMKCCIQQRVQITTKRSGTIKPTNSWEFSSSLPMKFSTLLTALTAVSSATALPFFKRASAPAPTNSTKTIILTNDDGWAATNIRATYNALKGAGYDVVLVAPVSQRSGFGGQFSIPPTANLTSNGEFSYPAKGAPSWNHEEDDMNIWYFNGTPASCVAFALSYVLPKFHGNKTADLVVAGPNEGTNLSPGFYTLSGTIAATYNSVYRGIPAVAFSGSNSNNSFFKDDEARLNDDKFAPNIYAKKVVEFVDTLFNSSANHPNLLPLTTGINVNLPAVGDQDETCLDPGFVYTRLSGPQSTTPNLLFNATLGLFEWATGYYAATEICAKGDCSLPSEGWVLGDLKCKSSVTTFSIDYDANYQQEQTVYKYLKPLFD